MSDNEKNNDPNDEMNDSALEEVSGGVQAGLITTGGSGEFGPKPYIPPERPKAKPYL